MRRGALDSRIARRRPVPRLASCLLAVAACSDAPPPVADTHMARPAVEVPVATDTRDPARDTGLTPVAPAARLALEGEGLRAFLVPSGSARPIPFGRPMADVVAAVTPLVGAAAPDVAPNADCAITAATWPAAGLTLWFRPPARGGTFVGWSVAPVRTEEPSTPLTTAAGLGLGSTRRELEGAYAATVRRSTLGTEFVAGGLAGLLESDRPDARVTALWAGESCIAR